MDHMSSTPTGTISFGPQLSLQPRKGALGIVPYSKKEGVKDLKSMEGKMLFQIALPKSHYVISPSGYRMNFDTHHVSEADGHCPKGLGGLYTVVLAPGKKSGKKDIGDEYRGMKLPYPIMFRMAFTQSMAVFRDGQMFPRFIGPGLHQMELGNDLIKVRCKDGLYDLNMPLKKLPKSRYMGDNRSLYDKFDSMTVDDGPASTVKSPRVPSKRGQANGDEVTPPNKVHLTEEPAPISSGTTQKESGRARPVPRRVAQLKGSSASNPQASRASARIRTPALAKTMAKPRAMIPSPALTRPRTRSQLILGPVLSSNQLKPQPEVQENTPSGETQELSPFVSEDITSSITMNSHRTLFSILPEISSETQAQPESSYSNTVTTNHPPIQSQLESNGSEITTTDISKVHKPGPVLGR